MSETEYPEHDRLHAIKDESQAQYDFIEWLHVRKNILLCDEKIGFQTDTYLPIQIPIQKLLAEYHEIDMNKIETEKRAMLAEIRELGVDDE